LKRAIKRRSVLWSEAALDDFAESITYIAKEDAQYARKVQAAIQKAGDGLGSAATGRRGRVTGTYEKSVPRFPYVIAYALDAPSDGRERVIILHVVHTARHWPKDQWPA